MKPGVHGYSDLPSCQNCPAGQYVMDSDSSKVELPDLHTSPAGQGAMENVSFTYGQALFSRHNSGVVISRSGQYIPRAHGFHFICPFSS